MSKFIFLRAYMITLLIGVIFLSFLHVDGRLRSTPDSQVGLGDKLSLNADQNYVIPKEQAREDPPTEVYPTGSTLPDCSHACGPCFPCKRVMVSFQCSIAESCPIVYRCMCKGKYYHVPSN